MMATSARHGGWRNGRRTPRALVPAMLLAVCCNPPTFGAVTESDEGGFVSVHEVEVAAPPERVFQALVAEVHAWWDPAHTYTGDASNLTFNEFPALWERLSDEGFVRHMFIDVVRPPRTLRLSGGLGPLQPLAVVGSMTFDLEPADGGTRLAYRYVVNGRRVEELAAPVDRVMGEQLARLKRYVETGSPDAKPDATKTAPE